jgi:hypothetical protein
MADAMIAAPMPGASVGLKGLKAAAASATRPTKLFIGGISRHTTTKHLQDHFAQYGRVLDCVAMKEPSGKSRGFGYVTFNSAAAADRALREPQKVDGRLVDMKLAVPDSSANGKSNAAPQKRSVPSSLDDIQAQQQMSGPVWLDSPSAFHSPSAFMGALSLESPNNYWATMAGVHRDLGGYSINTTPTMHEAAAQLLPAATLCDASARHLDCVDLLSAPWNPCVQTVPEAPGLRLLDASEPMKLNAVPRGGNNAMCASAPEFVPQGEQQGQQRQARMLEKKPARSPLGELTNCIANVLAGAEAKKALEVDMKPHKKAATPTKFDVLAHQKKSKPAPAGSALHLPLPVGSVNVPQVAPVSKLRIMAARVDENNVSLEQEQQQESAVKLMDDRLADAKPEVGSKLLVDILTGEPLPSVGSALHASGECRRCNFFAKGRCQNGKDCSFCHFPHDKRKLSRQQGDQMQQGTHLMLDADVDDSVSVSSACSPMAPAFVGLPSARASQLLAPGVACPPCNAGFQSLAAPPGLAAPASFCSTGLAWQPDAQPANPLAFLSTAPPSQAYPMATPTISTCTTASAVPFFASVSAQAETAPAADFTPRYVEISTQTSCQRCEFTAAVPAKVSPREETAVTETAAAALSCSREDMLRVRIANNAGA